MKTKRLLILKKTTIAQLQMMNIRGMGPISGACAPTYYNDCTDTNADCAPASNNCHSNNCLPETLMCHPSYYGDTSCCR
ncbi:MAG: hypothetical protein ACEPOV_03685 [Hyphomicrobiales bacterium]